VDGVEEQVVVDHRSLKDDTLEVGWPVGQSERAWLVELPRETIRGAWRLWVPRESVIRETAEAAA
jgi:hypothetical protein